MPLSSATLVRGLSSRHIQFIAFGGAIGAGLFLGSGAGIAIAGPALLAAYALAGVMVFFIARALGEMTLNQPRPGSFTTYAGDYFGPWCAFVTGWSYWLMWTLVGMAEITAVGIFMHFWFPDLPQWIPALMALLCLYGINMLGVQLFGELEFWLALIKIVTIIMLIVMGLGMILFGYGNGGAAVGFHNLWSHGGLLPRGWAGLISVLPIAFFAFGGIELIGITAAEAKEPERVLPRAINSVIGRILLFYIGSLVIIMSLFPWSIMDATRSPFVLALERSGFMLAAGVINFVVITAVMSSCNSGIFATGRVLCTLAERQQAPASMGRINARGVPGPALSASVGMMFLGVVVNYALPNRAFGYFLDGVAMLLLWNWGVIMACHWRYRRQQSVRTDALKFRAPFYPVSNVIVLFFIMVIVLLMLQSGEHYQAAVFAIVWFAALIVIHFFINRTQVPDLRRSSS